MASQTGPAGFFEAQQPSKLVAELKREIILAGVTPWNGPKIEVHEDHQYRVVQIRLISQICLFSRQFSYCMRELALRRDFGWIIKRLREEVLKFQDDCEEAMYFEGKGAKASIGVDKGAGTDTTVVMKHGHDLKTGSILKEIAKAAPGVVQSLKELVKAFATSATAIPVPPLPPEWPEFEHVNASAAAPLPNPRTSYWGGPDGVILAAIDRLEAKIAAEKKRREDEEAAIEKARASPGIGRRLVAMES